MKKKGHFPKRTYKSPAELFSDISRLVSNRRQIPLAFRGGLVSPAFRERLMLVVTQVNDCRYCSRFHSAEALKVGVLDEDIISIQAGNIPPGTPASEVAALMYARHWAGNNANPDPEEVKKLEANYDSETVHAIHLFLYMIRIGNLMGNTWDSWLYRLSFGRIGLPYTK